MGLVWVRCRAQLRAQWRGVVVLVLAMGVGCGVALTALAGARRADGAMPQFVSYVRPSTGSVFFGSSPFAPPRVAGRAGDSEDPPPYARAIVRLPQVATFYRKLYLFLTTDPRPGGVGSVNVFGTPDASLFRIVDRPLVVAGRLADPRSPFEAVVNEFAAVRQRLRVGSEMRLYAPPASAYRSGNLLNVAPSAGAGAAFTVRVAGIVRLPTDVSAIVPLAARQDVTYEGQQNVFVTPAFLQRMAHALGLPVQQLPVMNVFDVLLRHGDADWPAFASAARSAGSGDPGIPVNIQGGDNAGDGFGVGQAARSAQRGIHLEVAALVLFAALAALVTLVLVGQALVRQLILECDEHATLQSLGATRRQLLAAGLTRSAVVGAAGGVVAIVVAVLGSPVMPLGLARQAEIHPGVDVDLTLLVPAVAGLAALLLVRVAIPAWRGARLPGAKVGGGAPAGAFRPMTTLAAASLPAPAVVGVGFGLQSGRGRAAVPLAGAVAAVIVAVAGLAGALTFDASLGHLVRTPREQGWNWDVMVGNPNDIADQEARAIPLLGHNRLVESYAATADLGAVTVGRVSIPTVIALDPLKGSVQPPVLDGRAPQSSDEIALGTGTLHRLHAHLGQSITLTTPTGPATLRVVGRVIMPSVGDVLTNGLGEGAVISGSLVHRQWASPQNPTGTPPPGTDVFNMFAVRYAPGAPPAAAFASLRRDFGSTVLRHLPAEDAVNLQSVDRLPLILAALVGALGATTIGNILVVSVRRRQRDLAILKTLGFVRSQVAATVAWQATSVIAVALVVGLPVGVASGRWSWNLVASSIDAVSPPIVPAAAIVLLVPAALITGNLIAAWPGRTAARVAPAAVMRTE